MNKLHNRISAILGYNNMAPSLLSGDTIADHQFWGSRNLVDKFTPLWIQTPQQKQSNILTIASAPFVYLCQKRETPFFSFTVMPDLIARFLYAFPRFCYQSDPDRKRELIIRWIQSSRTFYIYIIYIQCWKREVSYKFICKKSLKGLRAKIVF